VVNRNVFSTSRGKLAPKADTKNRAGGLAYKMSDKHALVQYAVTNTFNNTYYARAEELLDDVAEICAKVDSKFIAQTAVYSRTKGYMKDMPAYLTAQLVGRGEIDLVKKIFPTTIDNGTQLKKFAQIIRSGVVGRKSFGSATRNVIRSWLDDRRDDQLFRDAVGGDISLADLIKMVHPKPADKTRSAFYAYLLGKEYAFKNLPPIVQHYENFKKGKAEEVPDVSFQYLTSLDIDTAVWKQIARNAKWMMTRMNINTFMRHGVFEGKDGKELIDIVANRLMNREEIKRARAFPYQLFAAYQNTEEAPPKIQLALQEAMEIACENVEVFDGSVVVCPDVSGSMSSPVTGDRGSATSKIRCIDVAALVAAVYLRKNSHTRVIPFEGDVVSVRLNPKDSIMTTAEKLAAIGGGSTECAAPLQLLNREKAEVDLIIIVSDSGSWVRSRYRGMGRDATPLMSEFSQLQARNPKVKMVLIDIEANKDSQAPDSDPAVLNIGGWSDTVFDVVNKFVAGNLSDDHIVEEVENVFLGAEKEPRRVTQRLEHKATPKKKAKRTLRSLIRKVATGGKSKKTSKAKAKKRK